MRETCSECGNVWPFHKEGCQVKVRLTEQQRQKDCKLGTELLEAIDNRDTVRIGRVLRGEANP